MTSKEKYNQLTPDQQKRINREVAEIKQAGQNAFWLDTGLHADDRRNYWSVVAYAMLRPEFIEGEGLGLPL